MDNELVEIKVEKCRTPNERFGATAAVTPQKATCGHERKYPAERLVKAATAPSRHPLGVMQSGVHSIARKLKIKNNKKTNIMKKVLKLTVLSAVLLIFVAGFVSCEDKKEMQEMQEIQQGCINEWCFDVENGSEFTDVVEVRFVLGDIAELTRSTLKNGRFTIILPETLDSNNLRSLSQGTNYWLPPAGFRPPTLTVSNENVRVGDFRFVGINKYGSEVAEIRPIKTEDGILAFGLFFVYADSDVTVSGYDGLWGFYITSMFIIAPNKNYSIELKKGWNVLWISTNGDISTNGGIEGTTTITAQSLTAPSIGIKWYGSRRYFHD